VQPLPGIADRKLASVCRVVRIIHDKGWINDDDPGVTAPGWMRSCSPGAGDYNNDLTTSNTPGDVWSRSFVGGSVLVVAPREAGAGRIQVQIDGENRASVDLSTTGARQAQQIVSEVSGLTEGKHTLKIVNRGPGRVSVDAIIVPEGKRGN